MLQGTFDTLSFAEVLRLLADARKTGAVGMDAGVAATWGLVEGGWWGAYGTGLDVFLQTETGGLAAPATYAVPHGGYDELDAGDIDGDGRTDVVVMSGQSSGVPNVSILLQTSAGTLGAPTSYSSGSGTKTATASSSRTSASTTPPRTTGSASPA